MQRSVSLDKVNGTKVVSNERYGTLNFSPHIVTRQRRRFRPPGSVYEHYFITIEPKLYKSNSLSDLTERSGDFSLDYYKDKILESKKLKQIYYNSSGDCLRHCNNLHKNHLMSSELKGKTAKNKPRLSPESYVSNFAKHHHPTFQSNMNGTDVTISSRTDNSSNGSTEPSSIQNGPTFPFKSTPSGHLKVNSNQSSTVGVLLADPSQAKVKVKFEESAEGLPDDESSQNNDTETNMERQLHYGTRQSQHAHFGIKNTVSVDTNVTSKSLIPKEDPGKDLSRLGYMGAEPIDWMGVQLPKKQDLFHEFYRRIHNYINTDCIVRVGASVFQCHHIVLQVYSNFFHANSQREIEISANNVTPSAFQTICEWMICNDTENNKYLKRENILDLFCAAQFLGIKDLEDQCWSFIVNENLFNEDTAFVLFREARKKGLTPVMDLMVPRVMRFFLPLIASKNFLSLEPEELMIFLQSNYICITSEIEVLMAGVRWLYGDWSSRKKLAVDVMKCVRFGLISPWQLVDIKRNPDNGEILEIVNEPEVQQMVDDGLAYVIIKYWYGNNSKNYYHWIDVLGLTEPAERNWIGEEKNHVTYKDFLKYLEQFMVPKEQMFSMQMPRRNNELSGNIDKMDDIRRSTMDFPLPATLKGLTGNRGKDFPTMCDLFDSKRKAQGGKQSTSLSQTKRPPTTANVNTTAKAPHHPECRSADVCKHQNDIEGQMKILEQRSQHMQISQEPRNKQFQQVQVCSAKQYIVCNKHEHMYEQPEKDSADLQNSSSSSSSATAETINTDVNQSQQPFRRTDRRQSEAASYLAAATAALSGPRRDTQGPSSPHSQMTSNAPRPAPSPQQHVLHSQKNDDSPVVSMFNESKESLAKMDMNKLSNSILGPSNKNYISESSLFNWDRETVLVFGGIDPHTVYGLGKNTGKHIYRFDPVTNIWDYVGDLPEPRHHHSIAFLRGRVYLVGGADPRDDDIRGKSVVVSTVWSFEPVSRSWFSENGLLTPRKNFGLVVHRMAMYAIGGQDKKGRVLRSVEKFDLKSGSWTEVRSMSVGRMAVACAKYRDYIWVAGGMTGEKKTPVCKIVECYNSKTNQWTEIQSLRFPRCFSTMLCMNDKLYIVGGAGKMTEKDKTASSVGAIDTWDWKQRLWKQTTEMFMPRHGHALAYLGTQLIIIGGVTTIYMRALNNVESYCCDRKAWIRGVATLPSPLSGHGAVTLPPASLM